MIISKYSGNVVGYLDYYAGFGRRVNAVTRLSSSQRVRREQHTPGTLANEYVRFYHACNNRQTGLSKQRFHSNCETGSVVDIRI
ncbi:hypothetical protein SDC9_85457 [bioreactor metagenome]|uniref:Uncharacterized protein n=1 Tax=bioreactor metagenome TaxID=1076179 RepID=A0A644ZDQ9_9ZZZZ